jgi:D-inositol-3-phosphate glycosyltransferase
LFNNKPSIITVHEILGKKWKLWLNTGLISSKILEFLEWLIVKLNFDRYICVSNSTKNQLKQYHVSDEKIDVIYNGVDYDIFDSKKYKKDSKEIREIKFKNNKQIYLFYGRPGGSKGFEYILKAVSKISRELPNSLFVAILGKRPEKRYEVFEKKIETHAYKENILLLNPVKYTELPKHLLAADIIVVPSLTEGFGYCVAESCALGKIVVASNTTSIPEVISGKHILVEPKKAREIAKAVVSAFKGKYNKTRLKKFTWEEFVDSYENTYRLLFSTK